MKATGKCRCIWPKKLRVRVLKDFYAWICEGCGKVKAISRHLHGEHYTRVPSIRR